MARLWPETITAYYDPGPGGLKNWGMCQDVWSFMPEKVYQTRIEDVDENRLLLL